MTGWSKDHISFPGAAARQVVQTLVRGNAFMTDRLELGGDAVRLKDITCPFLAIRATRDHIVPEPAAAPVIDLVASPDKQELRLQAGHVGLFVGRTAVTPRAGAGPVGRRAQCPVALCHREAASPRPAMAMAMRSGVSGSRRTSAGPVQLPTRQPAARTPAVTQWTGARNA